MSGNKFGIMVYLRYDHDPRWLYTWLLQLVYKLNTNSLSKDAMKFYISMLSPCAPTVVSFCKGLGIEFVQVEKPEVLTRFGGVSGELKSHHLGMMVDSSLVILSQDCEYDVYLDSLIKSFKSMVLLVPQQGQAFSNQRLLAIKEQLN